MSDPMASWQSWSDPAVRAELSGTPIVVLMGGASAERDVSLTSGRAALDALKDLSGASYDVAPPVLATEIDADGRWRVDGVPLDPTRALEALPSNAVFLLALHGGAGEDGRVQAFLRIAGRRHTGAGPTTSALCMHKHHARLVAADAGIAVAPAAFVTAGAYRTGRDAALERLTAVPGSVRFAKHASAGSSFGVFRCAADDDLVRAADEIAESGGDVLVEAEIGGLETTAGLVGDGADAAVLPVAEIVPRSGAFFDHEQKYASEGGAIETCPPVHLPDAIAERIQQRARTAWEAFGGRGYARIDFIVPCRTARDGARSFEDEVEPVLLEANTLPGFTPRSLLPLAAAADGVGFRELCLEVVARALRSDRS
ncbi:MAG: hypothetical protein AAGB93_04870 [Planctomycetota bacterium]